MKQARVLAAMILPGVMMWMPAAAALAADPAPTPVAQAPAPVLPAVARGKAGHVVIVVWDGLRPDLIRDDTTPTLARLAREGTFFARHHSVYPTSTEVNGTAIATGCFPGHSGIIGNREYRPEIDPLKLVATEAVSTIRRGDAISGGKYLAVPTLAELLQRNGVRTAIAGTKPVALLMDRAERAAQPDPARQSAIIFAGAALPETLLANVEKNQGAFPTDVHLPNTAADSWTAQALTTALWQDGPPPFSLLWLSEPDFSQHQFGVASPNGLRALASSDARLATVLGALEKGGWRETTDVFVVSDHGFSTIGQPVDVAATLTAAGLTAAREFTAPPKTGDILVDGLGGSVYLYVTGHDAQTIAQVVDVLQTSDFAGTILTKEGLPGTFALGAAHIDSPGAPDVVVALRWSDDKNAAGVPGTVASDGGRKNGQGTHATFSRFDVHNTLVANGPDFRAGAVNDTPSSNADVAPTVAWILGLPLVSPVDGRVLREALAGASSAPASDPPRTERVEASREVSGRKWKQYLQTTRFDGETYLDEANGASTPD